MFLSECEISGSIPTNICSRYGRLRPLCSTPIDCSQRPLERFVKEEGRGWGSLLLRHSPYRVSPFRGPRVMMPSAIGFWFSSCTNRSTCAVYQVIASKKIIR